MASLHFQRKIWFMMISQNKDLMSAKNATDSIRARASRAAALWNSEPPLPKANALIQNGDHL